MMNISGNNSDSYKDYFWFQLDGNWVCQADNDVTDYLERENRQYQSCQLQDKTYVCIDNEQMALCRQERHELAKLEHDEYNQAPLEYRNASFAFETMHKRSLAPLYVIPGYPKARWLKCENSEGMPYLRLYQYSTYIVESNRAKINSHTHSFGFTDDIHKQLPKDLTKLGTFDYVVLLAEHISLEKDGHVLVNDDMVFTYSSANPAHSSQAKIIDSLPSLSGGPFQNTHHKVESSPISLRCDESLDDLDDDMDVVNDDEVLRDNDGFVIPSNMK